MLQFTVDGTQYHSAPERNTEYDEFYIERRDANNGASTYGGGRFFYVDTPYSMCPLPPLQNWLSAKITTGEKMGEGGVEH